MFFNSYLFLFVFLPVVWAVYMFLARSPRAGVWWMTGASLFFYAMYRVADVPLLLASIAFNYGISLLIARFPGRPAIPALGIAGDLLALAVFKYNHALAAIAPAFIAPGLAGLHFPLGISFFTFSQIAYLVDTYRKRDKPAGIRDYSLFVTFFPHLLSGPILRHKTMVPQFDSHARHRILPRQIARGLGLIAIGLARKVLIADLLAPLVSRTFDVPGPLDAATAWLGTTAYTFQLYNDFGGYCDIASGVSCLFNIRIPENFRGPYLSSSIQEFWRRWHRSLGAFLRDYIYIPLGGNRTGLFRQCLAVVITFTLGGFWHGAGLTFALWGVLHGCAMAIHIVWKKAGLRLPRLAGWALTFAFIDLTWVVFRAPDLNTLSKVLGAMFSAFPAGGWAPPDWLRSPQGIGELALLAAIALALAPSYSYSIVAKMKPDFRTASLAAIFLTLAVLRFSSVSYFLYYFF
jgi:D-alanyl-lipoteichoic acid acyltransferase DltB (MBOAT superfamily)